MTDIMGGDNAALVRAMPSAAPYSSAKLFYSSVQSLFHSLALLREMGQNNARKKTMNFYKQLGVGGGGGGITAHNTGQLCAGG